MRVSHTGGSETRTRTHPLSTLPLDAFASRPRVGIGSLPPYSCAPRPLVPRASGTRGRARPQRLTREEFAVSTSIARGGTGGLRRATRLARRKWCDYIFLPGCNAARRDGVLRAHPEQEHAGSDPCLEAGVPERAQGTSKEPIEDFPRSRRRRGARHRPQEELGVASRFSARQTVFPIVSFPTRVRGRRRTSS
jgi:hypothetical protein